MIYLPLTTDKLQLVTSSAAAVDVNCNFVDAAASTLVPSGAGKQNTAISSVTTTDVLASPAASTTRTLKQMTARNKDATLSCDVTLLFNANGTTYELHKVTLLPGEALIYIEGVGFFTLKASAVLDRVLYVASDVSNSTTSFADVTGLTAALLSGKRYIINAALFHLSAATGTGANFSYNIGAAPTVSQFANISGVTNSVTAGAISLGSATARDTAITAQTTGSANVTMTALAGLIQPSADGTFAIRFSSEVAASAVTVKAGSWCEIREVR